MPTAGHGRHKARLFRARVPDQALQAAPEPASVTVPGSGWRLHNAAGVFSREQLDIGARFFMAHIPAGVSGDICDLGCGNGIIGMAVLQSNPDATLWCCDESALALASARMNIEAQFAGRQVHYHHGNGLDGLTRQFDLILLNPPFHIGHTVDDRVARMLFRHARRHLKPQGRLRVIGNRHLGYAALLRKHFARVTEVAHNSKFTIIDAAPTVAPQGEGLA
jgi:23S rRNA (guanine1835-N2)-methyltransferase